MRPGRTGRQRRTATHQGRTVTPARRPIRAAPGRDRPLKPALAPRPTTPARRHRARGPHHARPAADRTASDQRRSRPVQARTIRPSFHGTGTARWPGLKRAGPKRAWTGPVHGSPTGFGVIRLPTHPATPPEHGGSRQGRVTATGPQPRGCCAPAPIIAGAPPQAPASPDPRRLQSHPAECGRGGIASKASWRSPVLPSD
jgi:hypothetical protein